MTTEKMRVSASSVIRSVADTSATPASWRAAGRSLVMASVYHCLPTRTPLRCRGAGRFVMIRRAFIGLSIAWAAALPLTAFAASRAVSSAILWTPIAIVYLVGAVICHQRPERSFHVAATQFPVCARCTGIYLGAAIIAAAATKVGSAKPEPGRARTVLAAGAVPTVATLIFEW